MYIYIFSDLTLVSVYLGNFGESLKGSLHRPRLAWLNIYSYVWIHIYIKHVYHLENFGESLRGSLHTPRHAWLNARVEWRQQLLVRWIFLHALIQTLWNSCVQGLYLCLCVCIYMRVCVFIYVHWGTRAAACSKRDLAPAHSDAVKWFV